MGRAAYEDKTSSQLVDDRGIFYAIDGGSEQIPEGPKSEIWVFRASTSENIRAERLQNTTVREVFPTTINDTV